MASKTAKVISADGRSADAGPEFETHKLEDLIGQKPKTIYIYRGVMLTAGKPEAPLLEMIDELRPAYRGRLVVCHKEGETLSLAWRGSVPEDICVSAEIRVPKDSEDGQVWTVERSAQVN
jgi:hypothetical protein